MTLKRQVKILHARDGEPIYQSIRDAFADLTEVEVDDDPGALPESYQAAVGVVILTDDALADSRISDALGQLINNKIPVLPVVEDLDAYKFSDLPKSLKPLRKINALGWKDIDGDGEKAVTTIKGYIGLIPFKDDRNVFISYGRSDGRDVAVEVHNFLNEKRFWTFLDTNSIAGGRDVPKSIKKAISDRDLVLLIDSPGAAESKWVKKEIAKAFNDRVTVCALRLSKKPSLDLMREMPNIRWDRKDPNRFDRLVRFLSELIASKETFDSRCDRTLRNIADMYDCNIRGKKKRRLRLSKKNNSKERNFLIVYEDAPLDLERLYRLHTNYKSSKNLDGAIFLINRSPLSKKEQKAVDWAKGEEPLQVLALTEIGGAIKSAMKP